MASQQIAFEEHRKQDKTEGSQADSRTAGASQQSQCPECGGHVHAQGDEQVCGGCGLVVETDRIDHGPEWRSFDDCETNPDRVGMPRTALLHDNGMTTRVGNYADLSRLSGRKQARMRRLKHYSERLDSRDDRTKAYGLAEINRIGSCLNLPTEVRERAGRLYRQYHEAEGFSGRSLDAFAAASVYAAGRDMETPRPLPSVDDASRAKAVDNIRTAYSDLVRTLSLKIHPPRPAHYVPLVASNANLPSDATWHARKLCQVVYNKPLAQGRNPMTVAAGAVYVVANEMNGVKNRSQEDVADTADLSSGPIRAIKEDLRDHYDTICDDLANDGEPSTDPNRTPGMDAGSSTDGPNQPVYYQVQQRITTMASPNVTLDGDELTIEINKGNKQWVAEITGTDAQYDLNRNFISPYGQGKETVTVENGDIIERVYHSHSGNEKGHIYWIVHDSELVEINQDNVEDALETPESYYPELETHECEECGDEFDSEHGLSIHEGIKHSDGGETEDNTEEPTINELNTGDTRAKVMTDGGVVTDGGDETDWDLVAGDEPSRNGTRRIVSADEARTPYTDGSTHYDQLLGIEMEIGGQYNGDTIQYVNIQPQIPKRARRATGAGWLCRLAVEQGEYDDLYADGDAADPLPGYQAETTGDYREADPEDPRGDGVYARDNAESPLTAEIADVVTREGGRIPIDFSAAVQNEGYARSRDWTVYAPAHNPYHVAAAVTDLLRDADGVSEVRVHVSDKPASRIAQRLRATGIGFIFDRDDEADCIERALRELRWESGLPAAQQRILQAVPTEARERVQEADFDDQLTDYEPQLRTLHQRPGDAWNYHEVNIHINEEAADPYYG